MHSNEKPIARRVTRVLVMKVSFEIYAEHLFNGMRHSFFKCYFETYILNLVFRSGSVEKADESPIVSWYKTKLKGYI